MVTGYITGWSPPPRHTRRVVARAHLAVEARAGGRADAHAHVAARRAVDQVPRRCGLRDTCHIVSPDAHCKHDISHWAGMYKTAQVTGHVDACRREARALVERRARDAVVLSSASGARRGGRGGSGNVTHA